MSPLLVVVAASNKIAEEFKTTLRAACLSPLLVVVAASNKIAEEYKITLRAACSSPLPTHKRFHSLENDS